MTIREIAKRCGVSRGTVDRVINQRGKVHPDTEALIRQTLEQVGYTKNIAGRALTVRKTAPVIGVVLSSEGNPFFAPVLEGIRQAAAELADYNVTLSIATMRGYDPKVQMEKIDSLGANLSALVLHPINDRRIIERVAALDEAGIPTIAVNSDLDMSRRRCYVGSDYAQGGRTAAGLLRLATRGQARLGILTGVDSVLGHVQRLQGFTAQLAGACGDIRIIAQRSAQDDSEQAYQATLDMLTAHPEIDTLMMIAAGLEGTCRAVEALGRAADVRIFAFDNIPATEAFMRRGLVPAIISQQPFAQGYRSVRAAFDIILTGEVAQERIIMENQIKVLENLAE